jgi:hypothetical protein
MILVFLSAMAGVNGQDVVTLSAGAITDSVKFNDICKLSDGTYLVTGETKGDLSWTGATVITLDTTGTAYFYKDRYDPTDTSTGNYRLHQLQAVSKGFILHLSADRNTILRVVTLPDNIVENISKIRTTNVPGQPTGDMFISGKCMADSVAKGFFIARLDNNFVDGIPSALVYFRFFLSNNVESFSMCFNGFESYHRVKQPWDVDNMGRVVFVERREFSHGK